MDVHCDNCDAILDVTDDLFGKEIDCPGCGSRFVAVPMPDAPPAPPPAPPAPPPAPAKPLSRRILRSVVRVLLGTVLGLAIAVGTLYVLAEATTHKAKLEHSAEARVTLGHDAADADVETLDALLHLADETRLSSKEIERAKTLRAELAIHHPGVALRFSIGPNSISYKRVY